jgi:hypothetical protein
MAKNSVGLPEALTFSRVSQFGYRSRMGMIPSAEWLVYFDDFCQPVSTNVPSDWSAAIIDTSATITGTTTAAYSSCLSVTGTASANTGAAVYGAKQFQLTSGKRFFMEAYVKSTTVADSDLQFGLSDLTATTNPEDLWTTTAANLVSFGLLAGGAAPQMLADKSNSGSTAETASISMVDATWHRLAIFYDGAGLTGWVDGSKALTWSQAATTIPTGVALAPFFGGRDGASAGASNIQYFDYVRFVAER